LILKLNTIFRGFVAMTGNGAGVETPQTVWEDLFTLVVLILGVSTYATLIGNLSSNIQNMNAKHEDFREKMSTITELMDDYKLESNIQHRVQSCVEYLFGLEDGGGTIGQHRSDQWDVLNILPSYLRNEVLHTHIRTHIHTHTHTHTHTYTHRCSVT
jgi:hypothetical protein